METYLAGITALIIIVLILTLIKDGEEMNPPLKRRIIIDLTTILIFWGCAEFIKHTSLNIFTNEVNIVLNIALIFFFARMSQLLVAINPEIKDLFKLLKKKGVTIEGVEVEDEPKNN